MYLKAGRPEGWKINIYETVKILTVVAGRPDNGRKIWKVANKLLS